MGTLCSLAPRSPLARFASPLGLVRIPSRTSHRRISMLRRATSRSCRTTTVPTSCPFLFHVFSLAVKRPRELVRHGLVVRALVVRYHSRASPLLVGDFPRALVSFPCSRSVVARYVLLVSYEAPSEGAPVCSSDVHSRRRASCDSVSLSVWCDHPVLRSSSHLSGSLASGPSALCRDHSASQALARSVRHAPLFCTEK